MDGGIAGLLELIATHRGAVEYDWRTRFNLPLSAIGTELMTFTEAARLAQGLLLDPSSHSFAALHEWDYPMSREALVQADLFDLEHAGRTKKKPKPYPRPWHSREKQPDVQRHGNAAGRSAAQVGAILKGFGHDIVEGEVVDDGR